MKMVDIDKIKNEIIELSSSISKLEREISILNVEKNNKKERLNTLVRTLDTQIEIDFYEKNTD